MATSVRTSKVRARALAHGYRSGLEEEVADQLSRAGVPFEYEPKHGKVRYTKPARESTYTPDFPLKELGFIVETKGRFTVEDRQKHLLIKEQHPDKDIRFVFSNSRTRISTQSKTTYADWCSKHGFLYADKRIPAEWLMKAISG
jgi:hypothetical protein